LRQAASQRLREIGDEVGRVRDADRHAVHARQRRAIDMLDTGAMRPAHRRRHLVHILSSKEMRCLPLIVTASTMNSSPRCPTASSAA
jgi:hypothetical protein